MIMLFETSWCQFEEASLPEVSQKQTSVHASRDLSTHDVIRDYNLLTWFTPTHLFALLSSPIHNGQSARKPSHRPGSASR